MYQAFSPVGESFFIAEHLSEDTRSFGASQVDDILKYYQENGYVVIRDLLPKHLCTNTKKHFYQSIKPYKGLLQRHNGNKEANKFNNNGFMMNPLMNIHQCPKKFLNDYIASTLTLLTHEKIAEFCTYFLNGSGVGLLTWNQFEGNPETEPHHDCYFWGNDLKFGEVVGAWIALEDIHPGAGRLYVYPGSHKLDLQEFAIETEYGDYPLHPGEEKYQELMVKFLKQSGMNCMAPLLRAGDVLFWDARTIHGSLATTDPKFSRASFTAHYSLDEGRFVPEKSKTTKLNGVSLVYTTFNLKNFLSAKLPILRKPYQIVKYIINK